MTDDERQAEVDARNLAKSGGDPDIPIPFTVTEVAQQERLKRQLADSHEREVAQTQKIGRLNTRVSNLSEAVRACEAFIEHLLGRRGD